MLNIKIKNFIRTKPKVKIAIAEGTLTPCCILWNGKLKILEKKYCPFEHYYFPHYPFKKPIQGKNGPIKESFSYTCQYQASRYLH